jgi:protocatechuate 3,4-dioxygenase, alpha subunit
MEKLRQTPSQTIGPFFAYGLTAEQYGYDYNSIVTGSLIGNAVGGERIQIVGNVYDGNGDPVSDAMLELWQPDAKGEFTKIIKRENEGFRGFGRLGTGADLNSEFRFITIKPGTVSPGQAPHIHVILFMRGSLRQLYTRFYFSDETEANAKDELLLSLPEERKSTLIARLNNKPGGIEYLFDIRMQGNKETIFFDV